MHTSKMASDASALNRLIIGTDSPTGFAVAPMGIISSIAFLSGVADIPPEIAICCATGNTAKVFNLERGIIAPGKEADLLIVDAPIGSGTDALSSLTRGDPFGISLIIIDGDIAVSRSRHTMPRLRSASVQQIRQAV